MSRRLVGVTFPAWRDARFISLIEVLRAVADLVGPETHWRLVDTEFAPGWRGSEQLDALARDGVPVATHLLIDLVADGVQLVDGSIDGFRGADADPCISLRSVRGDAWDVCAEPDVLESVRRRFEMVEDIPC